MSAAIMKRCSSCKVSTDNSCFGYKTNGNEYKTCAKCRTKNPSRISKNNECLIEDYYQYKSMHDKNKPFLKFEEIVNTCHDYGYDILNKTTKSKVR